MTFSALDIRSHRAFCILQPLARRSETCELPIAKLKSRIVGLLCASVLTRGPRLEIQELLLQEKGRKDAEKAKQCSHPSCRRAGALVAL